MDRLDDVVATMYERILEEEPIYRSLPADDLQDVLALLRSNANLMARAIGGRRVTHEQLDFVAEHVRRRVRSSVPLEAVLQAYRTAMNAFWEAGTAEIAARGLSRDAAIDVARRMSEAMDTLTTHAAAAYVREESSVRAAGEKAARELLDALLYGDLDLERAEPYSAAPGLDPQADLIVLVGRVSAREDQSLSEALELAAASLADQLATRRASPLLVVRERAIVAIFHAEELRAQLARVTAAREQLRGRTGVELFCGLSSPCRGFRSAAAAYEEASLAVSRSTRTRPVVALAALPALQHLISGATGATLAQLLDRAVALDGRHTTASEATKHTLRAFAAADMSISRAAATLHVHENTMRYRLRRIREQTGHDPQTFDGLVELVCWLEARESRA